jgi:competence protein ComEA
MDRSASPWHALDGGMAPPKPDREHGSAPARWPIVGAIAVAVGLTLVALGLVASGPRPAAVVGVGADPIAAVETRAPAASPSPAPIVVHVAGAVRRPGIVHLPTGARVADAIDAAGGLGPRVDAARVDRELNLAAVVADGDHIVVPSRDDPAAAVGASPAASASGKVDLNHASAEALDGLPGIGPVTAAKIIAARQERPFATLDELVSRKVLGQATLAKIRDLVELR